MNLIKDNTSREIMELKNKGIDVFNPEDEKKLLREINANYPALKTVDHKNHA